MGYTHYWYRKPVLDGVKFAAAARECFKVCNALQIPLGDASGEGKPSFLWSGVIFNGHVNSSQIQPFFAKAGGLAWPTPKASGIATIAEAEPEAGSWFAGPYLNSRALGDDGDGSYEAFAVRQDMERKAEYVGGLAFDCCKTNYRPYDLCVQCCLIVFSEHFGPEFLIRSDGEDEQWNEARDVCQHVLGYGLLFQLADESPATLPEPNPEPLPSIDRDQAIKMIRAALKRRSGKAWSVTGGRGTAWGWITIDAPPARRNWKHVDSGRKDEHGYPVYVDAYAPDYEFGHMGPEDRAELTKLLGLSREVHHQGESIPASSGHYWEYVDRAEGREPRTCGKQYWD